MASKEQAGPRFLSDGRCWFIDMQPTIDGGCNVHRTIWSFPLVTRSPYPSFFLSLVRRVRESNTWSAHARKVNRRQIYWTPFRLCTTIDSITRNFDLANFSLKNRSFVPYTVLGHRTTIAQYFRHVLPLLLCFTFTLQLLWTLECRLKIIDRDSMQ